MMIYSLSVFQGMYNRCYSYCEIVTGFSFCKNKKSVPCFCWSLTLFGQGSLPGVLVDFGVIISEWIEEFCQKYWHLGKLTKKIKASG